MEKFYQDKIDEWQEKKEKELDSETIEFEGQISAELTDLLMPILLNLMVKKARCKRLGEHTLHITLCTILSAYSKDCDEMLYHIKQIRENIIKLEREVINA